MNGLTHGFTAAQAVIDPLEAQLFPDFADAITKDLRPQSATELTLVDQIISCAWRLRRVLRLESEHLRSHFGREGKTLGQSVLASDQQHRIFALSAHETRVQRALHRALEDLQKLRQMPKPAEQEQPERPVAWLEGGSDAYECAHHEFQWLHESRDAYYDLIRKAKSFEKIGRALLDQINYHDAIRETIDEILKEPPSPARDQKLANEKALLWKSERELLAYVDTIRTLRQEKNSKTEANSLYDHFEDLLAEALERHLPEERDPEKNEEEESGVLQQAEQEQLEAVEEAEEKPETEEEEARQSQLSPQPSVINSQPSTIDPPHAAGSVAADFSLHWSAAPEIPRANSSADTGQAENTLVRREATDQPVARHASPVTRKPTPETQDTSSLSERQKAALAQLRKYQIRLHETTRLENGPEKNKQFYLHQKLLEEYTSRNQHNLSGVPKDLLTFDPARDLPP